MEMEEARDYFSHAPTLSAPKIGPHGPKRATSVGFAIPSPVRPTPMSRMSTHRLDHSITDFAHVLHDDGGSDGLRKLDIDYFGTVLDIFKDKKQHHSPVIFDFMLLHEINIHHLEHLLIAEWDWLTVALDKDELSDDRRSLAEQAPRRLEEIRELLHKYSVALKDFEEMRQRATLDEASKPLSHSSWHERLMLKKDLSRQQTGPSNSTIRRLSTVMRRASRSKDDPELFRKAEATPTPMPVFGGTAPACRQLAGVEDWLKEKQRRTLSAKQKQDAERKEWLANASRRFTLAVFAGIALIAPMILMALVGSLRCSLTTTSIATLIFALIITYATAVSERDIVVVTAGYAAVLVVFVGAQNP